MKFEKVSAAQFAADCDAAGFAVEYAKVVMPRRATKGSAGYDICIPFDVVLAPHTSVKIPTGIRCTGMPRNVVMTIYIRSSVGIKRGVRFMNLLPVVDSDYADSPNEGHIWLALYNDSDKDAEFDAGERIAQAVFTQYIICDDDDAVGKREGGIGSTGRA